MRDLLLNAIMTEQNFITLMDDVWEYKLKNNPLLGAYSGDLKYNDRLPDISEDAVEQKKLDLDELLQRLYNIERDNLSEDNMLNYDILEEKLDSERQTLQYKTYRMPISRTGGPHTYFPSLHHIIPLRTKSHYDDYLKRLSQIPDYIDSLIDLMRNGMEEGQVKAKISMEEVVENIREQIVDDPTNSAYFKGFQTFPTDLSEDDKSEIILEASKIIENKVQPAYHRLADFIEREYIDACRDEVGINLIPDGEAYYKQAIKNFTSLDLTPEEIHEIGQNEVARILIEMKQTKEGAEFDGTLEEFREFLRNDEQFYPETTEELMQKTALILKKMDGKLPELFATLPRLPYGIREIPDYQAPHSTTAYYQPGSSDGTRSGTYYVNTYDLPSRPLYEMEALSLHEAVPGHHLQIALQLELDLPKFRKHSNYTAFVEGWGLYSERLGLETGFYQSPYDNFGRLSYEMWRACRLVVDTGIHALGWTRQQAIDFMSENTSLSLLNIKNEVDRYINWPGQALAYKLGELKIRELRQHAEEELGDNFDIRLFHDEILKDGSLPLEVLETKINNWIVSHK